MAAWEGTRPRGQVSVFGRGGTEDVCVILVLAAGLAVVHPEETGLTSSWLSLRSTRAAIRTGGGGTPAAPHTMEAQKRTCKQAIPNFLTTQESWRYLG